MAIIEAPKVDRARERERERRRRHYEANAERLREKTRRYYEANREQVREKARRNYEANSEQVLAGVRRWREANPEKAAASWAVKRAVKRGELVREPCLFCDDPKVEGHHHSYAVEDRLKVTWLCRRHHKLIHRKVTAP